MFLPVSPNLPVHALSIRIQGLSQPFDWVFRPCIGSLQIWMYINYKLYIYRLFNSWNVSLLVLHGTNWWNFPLHTATFLPLSKSEFCLRLSKLFLNQCYREQENETVIRACWLNSRHLLVALKTYFRPILPLGGSETRLPIGTVSWRVAKGEGVSRPGRHTCPHILACVLTITWNYRLWY